MSQTRAAVQRGLLGFVAFACLILGALSVVAHAWVAGIHAIVVAALLLVMATRYWTSWGHEYAPTVSGASIFALISAWGRSAGVKQVLHDELAVPWATVNRVDFPLIVLGGLGVGAAVVALALHQQGEPATLTARAARMWGVALTAFASVVAFSAAAFFDQGSTLWVVGAAVAVGELAMGGRLMVRPVRPQALLAALFLAMPWFMFAAVFTVPISSEGIQSPSWWRWSEQLSKLGMYAGFLLLTLAARYVGRSR